MIPDCKYHELLNIPLNEEKIYNYGKNDLYSLIIMLKQLLTKEEFDELINEIKFEVENLDNIVDTVSLESILNKIGFPSNWYDIKDLD